MKTYLDCFPCFLFQALRAARTATDDKKKIKKVLDEVGMMLQNIPLESIPPASGRVIYHKVSEITGNPDPYAEKKKISNMEALKILPYAENIISSKRNDEERFRTSALVAIVGNIIEFGIPGHEFTFEDIRYLIHRAEEELVIDDLSEAFRTARKAKSILFLTDNAGEIAFDTLLVKELKRIRKNGKVTVGVKGKPTINDATLEDALLVGMDKVADEIVTTGSDAIGFIPSEYSSSFLKTYEDSDFVVAKGMAYAETLTEFELEKPHLLLLRTKCPTVASYFGVSKNRNVAKML